MLPVAVKLPDKLLPLLERLPRPTSAGVSIVQVIEPVLLLYDIPVPPLSAALARALVKYKLDPSLTTLVVHPPPPRVRDPPKLRLPVITAFSSTVRLSVFTVPSKKPSLYCSADVPRSNVLVVLGLT